MKEFNLQNFAEAKVEELAAMPSFRLHRRDGWAKQGQRRAWRKLCRELAAAGINGSMAFYVADGIRDLLRLKQEAELHS